MQAENAQQRLHICEDSPEPLLLADAISTKISCNGSFVYFSYFSTKTWALSRENPTLLGENNKGADQPAHICSLNSAFVIRYL